MTDRQTDSGRDSLQRYALESSQRHLLMISEFCRTNKLESKTFEHGEHRLMLIGDSDFLGIDAKDRQIILDTRARIKKGGIFNNCYYIAAMATYTRSADGALHTQNGASDFVGYGNHSINYISLPDQNLLAIDFTAGDDIDHEAGNFDVLAVQANSMDELLKRLSNLYGGKWEPITHEETIDTYRRQYPDNDTQRQEARKRQEQRWKVKYGSSD